jgi:hypothetical protein
MKDGMYGAPGPAGRSRLTGAATGSPVRRSLAMGAACAPAGLVVGAFADRLGAPDGPQVMWAYGLLAAFFTGFLAWRGLAAMRPGVLRGAAAGAVTGALSPATCSALMSAMERAQDALAGVPVGPGAAFKGLFLAVLMGLVSLYYAGGATVPLGAAIGAVVGAIQRRLAERSAPPDQGPRPGVPPRPA